MKRSIEILNVDYEFNVDFYRFEIYLDSEYINSSCKNYYLVEGKGKISVISRYYSAITKEEKFKTTELIDYTRSKRHGILNFQVRDVESGRAGHILAMIAFTPIRVECLHYAGHYEMLGLSPIFPELSEGTISPNYELIVTTDNNGDLATVTLRNDN